MRSLGRVLFLFATYGVVLFKRERAISRVNVLNQKEQFSAYIWLNSIILIQNWWINHPPKNKKITS